MWPCSRKNKHYRWLFISIPDGTIPQSSSGGSSNSNPSSTPTRVNPVLERESRMLCESSISDNTRSTYRTIELDLLYFVNFYLPLELKQGIIILQRFLSRSWYTLLPTAAKCSNWVTVLSNCILRRWDSITSRRECQIPCVRQQIIVRGYKQWWEEFRSKSAQRRKEDP